MTRLQFLTQWQSVSCAAVEERETSAFLTIRAGDIAITQSQDIWSKTVRDSVLVSTYPLAMWLAASWWRLGWEPLPKQGLRPAVDWRMAHEMGAANQGYVWPQVVFASDNEVMQIWATAPQPSHPQSIRYLAECSVSMPLSAFQADVADFVDTVVRRLVAVGCEDSDLAQLWQLVQADRQDPDASRYRRIEAALGYDPDECPAVLMEQALSLDREMGGQSFFELAPLYGKFNTKESLAAFDELRHRPGMVGTPNVPKIDAVPCASAAPPWEQAVAAARSLRKKIGLAQGAVPDQTLFDLLGLSAKAGSGDLGPQGQSSLGIPQQQAGRFKFIARKRHPVAKRFELSRFIADLVRADAAPQWLASTDLSTSRQKFQRAFAAEFLCPIDSLTEFLDADYSESAIEDAAQQFNVSERTVESLLANNGLIQAPLMSDYLEARLPYSLSA